MADFSIYRLGEPVFNGERFVPGPRELVTEMIGMKVNMTTAVASLREAHIVPPGEYQAESTDGDRLDFTIEQPDADTAPVEDTDNA